eukprot:2053365-Rhodomonas_salina.1
MSEIRNRRDSVTVPTDCARNRSESTVGARACLESSLGWILNRCYFSTDPLQFLKRSVATPPK